MSAVPPNHKATDSEPLPYWKEIPQIVPSSWCFSCDVCCRFPESDSLLIPYFTAEEVTKAIEAGIPPAYFPDPSGCKITLVPYRDGYICPCFSPEENRCRIYQDRPLDCRIYPFALMRDPADAHWVLGLDTKCPFIQENAGTPMVQEAGEALASRIESPLFQSLLQKHPELINVWQDDVRPLKTFAR